MREHPCHAGTPSFACGREAPASSPHALGAVRGRTPALCHELSCSPCRCRSSAVPFLHIVPSARVPFRSIPCAPPPAWAPPSGGTLFARVSLRLRPRLRRVRLRAFRAGTTRAPGCARAHARPAGRKAHVSCTFRNGFGREPLRWCSAAIALPGARSAQGKAMAECGLSGLSAIMQVSSVSDGAGRGIGSSLLSPAPRAPERDPCPGPRPPR